jgi:hypothetical protein
MADRSRVSRPLAAAAALVAALALASCGSGGSGAQTGAAQPGPQRGIKGERPGQEAASSAHLSRGACSALANEVEDREHAAVKHRSEPSPPLSHCRIWAARGLFVNVYLDTGFAAHQRYENRMEETVQFGVSDPRSVPHPVAGVGEPAAGNHDANWVPSQQTLYAVRGNRWVTVAIAVPHTPASRLRAEAARLAIRAFRLTAQAAS